MKSSYSYRSFLLTPLNKKIYSTLFLLMLSIGIVFAQRPSSSVEIAEGVYIDETEIDVGSWLSYYSWLLVHRGYEAAQRVLPDSTQIDPDLYGYIKKYALNRKPVFEEDHVVYRTGIIGKYSEQPIANPKDNCREISKFGKRIFRANVYCTIIDFPITGITYEQALGFCEWRTKVQGKGKVVFRLPSSEEWIQGALLALPEAERIKRCRDSIGFISTCKCQAFNYHADHPDRFYDTCCIPPNNTIGIDGTLFFERKIYSIFGNVSEMTAVKGVAKGGNYTLYANQCHMDSVQEYSGPQRWLGFRSIAVKKKQDRVLSEEHIPKKELSLEGGRYDSFVDPRDGNAYRTIRIYNQVWMADNLFYKPDSGVYWSWKNDSTYAPTYGYLYPWKTAKHVCPAGWHLPNKEEFETLLTNVEGSTPQQTANSLVTSGSSGFDINLTVGGRLGKDNFSTWESVIWTSDQMNRSVAWALWYSTFYSRVPVFEINGVRKKQGYPVRCIKDSK